MKEKIKAAALAVFDEKGFYKAGIRDVAALASCSLPTLYYYYKNKEALFEASVCDSYEFLVGQIEEQLPEGLHIQERLYFEVLQRQLLPDEDKRVVRIAIKMFLGVDGFPEARERLVAWENKRKAVTREKLMSASRHKPAFADMALRVVDNMLQTSILFGEQLSSDQIRAELRCLFDAITVYVF
ncbi:hypothetical protein FACS18949_16430 [Clostridia bacterium]|nr:hypothetical protein FACS18949_16430 [Clostridia bacterium]